MSNSELKVLGQCVHCLFRARFMQYRDLETSSEPHAISYVGYIVGVSQTCVQCYNDNEKITNKGTYLFTRYQSIDTR